MKELIEEINSDSKCLSDQLENLKKLEYSYKIICGARTQQSVSVHIGNGDQTVSIQTTEMDRGYCQVLSKGMDMINLGAKKLYLSRIETQKEVIKLLKNKIKLAAENLARI
jgi:hypothetical protein